LELFSFMWGRQIVYGKWIFVLYVQCEARSQMGGDGGNSPPLNSESCTKHFQVNLAFDV